MLAQQGTILQQLADYGPVAVEYKYDGSRIQFHRVGNVGRCWSRRLEEVTHALPEVDQETPCAMMRFLFLLRFSALHIIEVIKFRIPKRNISNRAHLFPEVFNRQIRRKRRSEFTA